MNVSPISSNNSYTSFQGRVIPVGFRWPKRMICALKKSKSLQKLADEKNINIYLSFISQHHNIIIFFCFAFNIATNIFILSFIKIFKFN